MSMKSSNIWKFYSLKNVNNLLKNFISTRSTHFRRTICSAKCVLAGIYCKSHEETPDGRHLRLMNVNFHFCNFFNLNKILLLFDTSTLKIMLLHSYTLKPGKIL